MISQISTASCKIRDFVHIINGFERINYTMSLLQDTRPGQGLIGQLISEIPNLTNLLEYWNAAFNHAKAKEIGLLIPERGQEEEFDESQDHIERILARLDTLLKKTRKKLSSTSIKYKDCGTEIYQFEVPIEVKGIPNDWDQMSTTQRIP